MHDPEPKVPLNVFEIVVAMQKLVPILHAKRGDQTINRAPKRHAQPAQDAEVLCGLER
jgi:hypothetical protein